MHHQVQKQFDKLMQETEGRVQHLVMTDIAYLYRHNPVTKSYYDWDALGDAYTEPAAAEDHAIILVMVQHRSLLISTLSTLERLILPSLDAALAFSSTIGGSNPYRSGVR
jgi:hypothetical protein